MPKPLIFLASASPRRSELLRQIGIEHVVRPVEVDEARRPRESATAYVCRLAEAKARSLWDGLATTVDARARLRWSLSSLTLPHGLVRVVAAEALYRAVSLIKGLPYHRA